ncbi:cation-dependent mannose-6-phosphate receptor-like isoform X2 [Diadema setosum]
MLHLITTALFLFASLHSVLSDCTVTSPSETQYLSLLEPLKGQTKSVTDVSKNYTYHISFCQPVEKGQAVDAGVEQFDLYNPDRHIDVIGRITATNIMAGTNWLLLEYRNGDPYHNHCGQEARRATIFIMCDPNNFLGEATLIEENNEKNEGCAYIFEVGSSVVCSNSTTAPSSGMGVGGIIVITALSVAGAYLILGMAYKRFVLGAKGREQIPNVHFWVNFGSLTADGCDFLCRCQKKEESKSYKGLGDDQLGLDEEEEHDENILPM